MTDRKRIALVHTTLNPVDPMRRFMQANAPEFFLVHYLDGYLMDKIREEGFVSSRSVNRMLDLLARACEDKAAGIIMTCTVFSPYQKAFNEIFPVPIIGPDSAMQDDVASRGGKTAIVFTNASTVDATRRQYYEACRRHSMPEKADIYVIDEALEAFNAGDAQRGNALIRAKVCELDKSYDQIMLAQISMSQASEGLELQHAELFTSPSGALREMRRLLGC